ncbi:hypothetical protein O6H91_Y431600 [Diphasiastrum complanatum]|nr:hypothetical protein O6H91_Y431600 [Diphasiastrum complanatum]
MFEYNPNCVFMVRANQDACQKNPRCIMARTTSSGPSSLPLLLIFGIMMVLATGKLYMSQDRPPVVTAPQRMRCLMNMVMQLTFLLLAATKLLISTPSSRNSFCSSQRPHSFSEFDGSTCGIALLIGVTSILIRYELSI